MIRWWLWNWFCISFWSVMENSAKCKIQLLHQNYQIPCCEIWNIWRCGFSERVCAAYQVWNQTSHKRISFHSFQNNQKFYTFHNAHRILREFNILQWLLSPLLSTEFSYQMEFANVSCLRFYLDSQEMRSACDSSKAANNWNPKFPFSVEKRSFFDFPVP